MITPQTPFGTLGPRRAAGVLDARDVVVRGTSGLEVLGGRALAEPAHLVEGEHLHVLVSRLDLYSC